MLQIGWTSFLISLHFCQHQAYFRLVNTHRNEMGSWCLANEWKDNDIEKKILHLHPKSWTNFSFSKNKKRRKKMWALLTGSETMEWSDPRNLGEVTLQVCTYSCACFWQRQTAETVAPFSLSCSLYFASFHFDFVCWQQFYSFLIHAQARHILCTAIPNFRFCSNQN